MSNATATATKAKVDTIGTQYMKCVVSLLISVIYSVMFDGSAPSGTTNWGRCWLLMYDNCACAESQARTIVTTHSQQSETKENERIKSRWRKSKLSENKNVRNWAASAGAGAAVDCLAVDVDGCCAMCHHFSFEIRSSKISLCVLLFSFFRLFLARFSFNRIVLLFYRFKHSTYRQTRWTKETSYFVVFVR